MTERVRGATRSAGLSGYPYPGAAIAMTALGALATLLSLLSGNWWLVVGGVATAAVGARWWFRTRPAPGSDESTGTAKSPSDLSDGHR